MTQTSRRFPHEHIVSSGYSLSMSSYREDFGKPHWYPEIFQLEDVQAFLDSVLVSNSTFDLARPFTLTVAHPADSGALHGWRIQSLRTPGRYEAVINPFNCPAD